MDTPAAAPLPGQVADRRRPPQTEPLGPRAFRPCGPTGFPAHPLTPAAWRLLARVWGRLGRFPLFSGREYAKLHPGPGRLLPRAHYLLRGAYRDRGVASPPWLAKALAERLRLPPPDTPEAPADPPVPDRPIGVYASSRGNAFMAEIADDLAASLAAAGAAVVRDDERGDPARRAPTCIFVAPHEFFALGRGPAWATPAVLRRGVCYGTEQPQTPWFWRALPFVLAGRGALDLSWHTAALLGEVMPSAHLTPGVSPAPWRAPDALAGHPLLAGAWWRGDDTLDPALPLAERPLDLVFFGGATPARDRFFSRHAARLAEREAVVYLRRRGRGPVHPRGAEGDLCAVARLSGGRAKLVLSVHRDVFGAFEWHRLVRQAMAVGAVAVAETGFAVPDFRPGEHYFCAEADRLPDLVDWLLDDPDGRAAAEAARERCFALLAGRLSPAAAGRRLLAFLAGLGEGRHAA